MPLAGNEAKLNRDLIQDPSRKAAVEKAEREGKPAITRTVTLFRGGVGFVVYEPVVVEGRPNGFIAATFSAPACFQHFLPPAFAAGNTITISEGGRVLYERDASAPPRSPDWIAESKIELPGATWVLRTWPTPDLVARLDSPLPKVVFCGGILGSLLLAAVCYLAQRFASQATTTARANAALETALAEVRTLASLLPICSCCKRVRDDTGYWSQIDSYLHKHVNASFSHGYCPACAAKTFQEFGFEVPDEVQAELDSGNSD